MKHRNRINKVNKPGWLKHAGINFRSGLDWWIKNSNRVTVYEKESRVINADIYRLIAELHKQNII